jgi:hypothetical protein
MIESLDDVIRGVSRIVCGEVAAQLQAGGVRAGDAVPASPR